MKKVKQAKGISVIVPVYNVEKYLEECVRSLIKKEYDNVEILLVDDGSKDNSSKLCDQYAKESKMVRVFHKKNGGLSDARNYGIEQAQYDHLLFIDSDDWVDEKMFDLLLAKIEEEVDVVLFDAYEVQDGYQTGNVRKTFFGQEQTIKEFVLNSTEPSYACARMYKKDLFDKIKFPTPDLWYEDIATIPAILSYAKKIEYMEVPLYYYRQREGSITSKAEDDRNLDIITCCERAMKLGNKEYKQEMEYAMYYVLNSFISYRPKFMDEYLKTIKKHKKEFEKNPYIQNAIQVRKVENWLEIELIPKVIHYFWMGSEKPESVKRCIESWKRFAPDYEIVEWNATNCDINECAYTKEAYEAKKYAFVSDYFRMKVLYEQGGIYMDTDMELYERIDFVRNNNAFFPFEAPEVCAGIIGAVPHHPIIKEIFDTYQGEHFTREDGTNNTRPIPYRITEVLKKHYKFKNNGNTVKFPQDRFTIYSPDILIIDVFNGKNMAVHHYDATWWDVKSDRGNYGNHVLEYYFLNKKDPEKRTLKKWVYETGRNTLHFILPSGMYKALRKLYRKIKPRHD